MAQPRKKSRVSIDAELALTSDVLAKAQEIVRVLGVKSAARILAYCAWRVRGWNQDRDRWVATISE